jgi:hypothetical protein
MPFNKTIKREWEVAITENTQPRWLRIFKYVLLGGLIYFLRESDWLWTVLITLFVVSLAIHFWFRYKTHGWTKSYGPWKHTKISNDD